MNKNYRLLKNEDFSTVIHKGEISKSESFIVYFYTNTLNKIRVGISVSKKRGNAVIRNRLKRQTRSMCDSLLDYPNYSFDIVIVVKDGFKNKTYQENHHILENLFSKFIGNKNEEKN